MKKLLIALLLMGLTFSGCGKALDATAYQEGNLKEGKKDEGKKQGVRNLAGVMPKEDSRILKPSADGRVEFKNSYAHIDASNTDCGYIMARYDGENEKVKLRMETPDGDLYTYAMHGGEYEVFPLTEGDGEYKVNIYENTEGDQYVAVMSEAFQVSLKDSLMPFLYPNQYVNFTEESDAVKKGRELCEEAEDEIDIISSVYHYVVDTIDYDDEKAKTVAYGYLPDVDAVLAEGKGICFDYAAVMAVMLRSQGIPTRLEVGYVEDVYHAWISVYTNRDGWVDGAIQFDGDNWHLMDPTFAASMGIGESASYIDGGHYTLKYTY